MQSGHDVKGLRPETAQKARKAAKGMKRSSVEDFAYAAVSKKKKKGA